MAHGAPDMMGFGAEQYQHRPGPYEPESLIFALEALELALILRRLLLHSTHPTQRSIYMAWTGPNTRMGVAAPCLQYSGLGVIVRSPNIYHSRFGAKEFGTKVTHLFMQTRQTEDGAIPLGSHWGESC